MWLRQDKYKKGELAGTISGTTLCVRGNRHDAAAIKAMILSHTIPYAKHPFRVKWDADMRHFAVRTFSRQHVEHVSFMLALHFPYIEYTIDAQVLESLYYSLD